MNGRDKKYVPHFG